MPMSLARRIAVVSAIVAVACGSTQPARWSGEMKNSDEQLSPAQRTVLRGKLEEMQRWMPKLAAAARSLAVLVENGEPGETAERRKAALELADELRPILDRHPELRSLGFLSGDFFALVTVSKAEEGSRIDFEKVEPHLREQIGFFPEDLHTKIEDPAGYPQPQFIVATRGRGELRIRMPLVADGIYLGDLVAEYELDKQ